MRSTHIFLSLCKLSGYMPLWGDMGAVSLPQQVAAGPREKEEWGRRLREVNAKTRPLHSHAYSA